MADDEVTERHVPPPSSDGPTQVETETRPDDAPWGYKADGTPYKVDPARYARRDAGRRKGKTRAGAAKPKVSPYAETVTDLLVLVSGGFAIASKASGNVAFLADAVTVEESAPGIGDAFGKLADQNENVARMLDKLAEVGPYGLVLAAVSPMLVQCMANHGTIPAGMMGTEDPEAMLVRKFGPGVFEPPANGETEG